MSRVFVLGNATVDMTLSMAAWPRPGETVLADGLSRGAGGKGLNQAHAAARAGAEVTLAAPVGPDADGAFLRDAAVACGLLGTSWRECAAPTDISTIWLAEGGENMIASTAGCARSIAPDEVADLLEGIGPADVLILQGNLLATTTLAACRHARDAGARVVLNTAPIAWDMRPVLALSDVIVCNAPEARLLCGRSGAEAVVQLRRSTGADVVLTQGAEGAVVAGAGDPITVPAPRVVPLDTSGAGDVAVGFLAADLARGRTLREAAETAVRAASVSVTRHGTLASCPTRGEIAGEPAASWAGEGTVP